MIELFFQEEHDSPDLPHLGRRGPVSLPPGSLPHGQRIIGCSMSARLAAGLAQGLRGWLRVGGASWRSAWTGRGLQIQVSALYLILASDWSRQVT